ncbi:MAG: hypothetical protein ACPLRH_00040 [Desulfotomaculales bacterium]
MIKANDEVIRNLRRPEIRGVPKRRWDWTRCKPLMIAIAAFGVWAYLKWAGIIK